MPIISDLPGSPSVCSVREPHTLILIAPSSTYRYFPLTSCRSPRPPPHLPTKRLNHHFGLWLSELSWAAVEVDYLRSRSLLRRLVTSGADLSLPRVTFSGSLSGCSDSSIALESPTVNPLLLSLSRRDQGSSQLPKRNLQTIGGGTPPFVKNKMPCESLCFVLLLSLPFTASCHITILGLSSVFLGSVIYVPK